MSKPPLKLLDASAGRPRLDRYELIAELAAGGMATVYLARIGGAGGFQRFVAIKRLHPHLAHEQEFVEMFLDEARLAASIHHPNVVPILEVGESEQGYYLVMEYIEGETLWTLRSAAEAAKSPLDLGVALRVTLDTLLGLHAAHELCDESGACLNVVHRDVSPQNVLVGVDGTARITDFGVARASSRLSSTRSGEIKGKLAYMAPEQVRGEEIDRRADVFAMGVILWELLANKHLFLGASDAVSMSRVLFEPVPDIRTVNPKVPMLLSRALMRALERDVSKRPATCAELADSIERAVKGTIAIASGREVAAMVERLMGAKLYARRELVNGWLASTASESTNTGIRLPAPSSKVGPLPAPGSHPSRPQGPGSQAGRQSAPPVSRPSGMAQSAPPPLPESAPTTASGMPQIAVLSLPGTELAPPSVGSKKRLVIGLGVGALMAASVIGAVVMLVGAEPAANDIVSAAPVLSASAAPALTASAAPSASAVELELESEPPAASAQPQQAVSAAPQVAAPSKGKEKTTKGAGPAVRGLVGVPDDMVDNPYHR